MLRQLLVCVVALATAFGCLLVLSPSLFRSSNLRQHRHPRRRRHHHAVNNSAVVDSHPVFVSDANDEEAEVQRNLHIHNTTRDVHVFCYGDSLTAGVSSATKSACPYSQSLLASLEDTHGETFFVDHIGISGFSAWRLRNHADFQSGLRYEIGTLTKPPDLVILWAGTNDVKSLSGGKTLGPAEESKLVHHSVHRIVANLLELHDIAHQLGVKHTIAIGIPGSRLQEERTDAFVIAQNVNHMLYHTALGRSNMTYIDMPFRYIENGTYWSGGVHPSCEGYDVLGKHVANVVRSIFKPDD